MVLSDKALYPVLVLNSIRSQNLKTIKLRTEYKTSTKAEIKNVICNLFSSKYLHATKPTCVHEKTKCL